MRVLESIGLIVQKSMKQQFDIKGAVEYANNWSTGGRVRHSTIRRGFLREMEQGHMAKIGRYDSGYFCEECAWSSLQ
jgi:hypothetical protein